MLFRSHAPGPQRGEHVLHQRPSHPMAPMGHGHPKVQNLTLVRRAVRNHVARDQAVHFGDEERQTRGDALREVAT